MYFVIVHAPKNNLFKIRFNRISIFSSHWYNIYSLLTCLAYIFMIFFSIIKFWEIFYFLFYATIFYTKFCIIWFWRSLIFNNFFNKRKRIFLILFIVSILQFIFIFICIRLNINYLILSLKIAAFLYISF